MADNAHDKQSNNINHEKADKNTLVLNVYYFGMIL